MARPGRLTTLIHMSGQRGEAGAQYWFNTRTGRVETDVDRGQGADLMGPYATHGEAAAALDSARKRTEAWDEEDRRWRDGG
jgi:hypothetical protein